jgi:hypothetical protein
MLQCTHEQWEEFCFNICRGTPSTANDHVRLTLLPLGRYEMSTEDSADSLLFTPDEVDAFYAGVRAGEFTRQSVMEPLDHDPKD